MLLSPPRPVSIPRPRRFGYLMALYAENLTKFQRLIQPERCFQGLWRSSLGEGPDLYLEVLERHRYTTEFRLSYNLRDPLTGQPDPHVLLRQYHDAHLLEASHCHAGRRWQDVLGLHPAPATLVGHRLRMNIFLGKWLDYLAEQGHSPFTLSRADDTDMQKVLDTHPTGR